jgi:hypothetical protein
MYRAINTTASQQRTVCGIYNSINLQPGYITAYHPAKHKFTPLFLLQIPEEEILYFL